MKNFLSNLSGRQRLFGFVLLLFFAVFLFTLFAKDLTSSLIVSVIFVVILWLTRPIWLPKDYGKAAVRKLSLGIALTAVLSYSFWNNFVQGVVKGWLVKWFPDYNFPKYIEDAPPALAFAFLLFVIFIVNYFMRDKTAMGIHENPIDKDIPEKSFDERVLSVVESLTNDLQRIDIDTKWSPSLFTRLDAEVEVITPNGREKRITDLINAISKSTDNVFLVLGSPGSGKSVALRKLAQDLGKEAKKTHKIPVYINLKEWTTDRDWTDQEPPTVEELNTFIFENLKNRDIITSRFFKKYYYRLYETGHLYFILDSFDEIPAVLDEAENSPLIKELSHVIFKFIKGASSKETKGILASRIFRKPTDEFQTKTTLEIRPFSEEKVRKTLRKSTSEEVITEIFKSRPDLLPLARNPFSAMLISEFMEDSSELPKNKSELFENYINKTLNSCESKLQKYQLTKAQTIEVCIEIAKLMFNKYGLEVPISEIKKDLPDAPIDEVIDIITFTRIGRVGSGDKNKFSFVHRRFAEYFMVQTMLNSWIPIDLETIPNDSQYRDALVLYCEIAPEEKAIPIADFCWKRIKEIGTLSNIQALHCLRFLKEAFIGRKECLVNFQGELFEFAQREINRNNSLLTVKHFVESIGLLNQNEIELCLFQAFRLNNSWINEITIKSCRGLTNINDSFKTEIEKFFFFKSTEEVVLEYKELSFSMSLSNSLKNILFLIKVRYYHFICKAILLPFIFLVIPILFLMSFIMTACSLGFVILIENFIFQKIRISNKNTFILSVINFFLLDPTNF